LVSPYLKIAGALSFAMTPVAAMAQPLPAVPSPAPIALPSPNSAAVERFYASRKDAGLWLTNPEAQAQVLATLRESTVDGFTRGPEVATQAEALIARAAAGDTAAASQAERLLTEAWVGYMQFLSTPIANMIYGDNWVRPRAPSADNVLYRLQTAPNLAAYVRSAPSLNPLYGQMRAAAVAELKLPGGGKSALLAENLARARFVPPSKRYVIVDVPSARMWMYENNQPVDSMKLVVGMDQYRTPLIASVIYYTTFNPYWHVPDHLVRKAVAPNVLRSSTYLKTKGYEVVSEWSDTASIIPASEVDWKGAAAGTVHVKMRQKPGGDNSMGKMKFPFENGDGVFLHDTYHREHFAKSVRTISNGCVRLEDAPRFVRWLYGRDVHAEGVGPDQDVVLPTPVPVYLLYMTARPEGGTIAYEPDPYRLDKPGGSKMVSAK
jgi:L,D-transpeptidase YcbB